MRSTGPVIAPLQCCQRAQRHSRECRNKAHRPSAASARGDGDGRKQNRRKAQRGGNSDNAISLVHGMAPQCRKCHTEFLEASATGPPGVAAVSIVNRRFAMSAAGAAMHQKPGGATCDKRLIRAMAIDRQTWLLLILLSVLWGGTKTRLNEAENMANFAGIFDHGRATAPRIPGPHRCRLRRHAPARPLRFLAFIAVGTPIAGRPPQSGRIEARTGLRMMPTSPRSPLSFRTAGFPRYGWKAGLSDGAFPRRWSA